MIKTLLGRERLSFVLSVFLPSALLLIAFAVTSAYALPITVNVNIPKVKLIQGTDDAGGDELYSKAGINNSGFQVSGIKGGVDDGETVYPNWNFSGTIDPRGRTNYNIPIVLQLWDDDWPLSDEQIDINPNKPTDLTLTYNLQSQRASLSSPRSGGSGDRATIYFNITSNPFRHDYGITPLDTQATWIGPGVWQYEYTLTNLVTSTFDINTWTIPVFGEFDVDLQPGEQITIGPFRSTTQPAFAYSWIAYDDLNRTGRLIQLVAPIPEPASIALFSIGLAGLAFLIKRGKKKAVNTQN
ncbi:MAG: PEP-CTERM sorting domain-containing protein [Nitrospirales bacterium]|nr:PEP-CTERM sorting domain-containing protein [Nitrospirales bacterium]